MKFGTDNAGTRASWAGPPMLLADACAMFEHFGLRVAAQHGDTYEFDAVEDTSVLPLVADACTSRFRVDRYARLITSAGIPWREAELVRALCRFLVQTPLGYTEAQIVAALVRSPDFVRAIVALFTARSDEAELVAAALVDEATSLDDDRIRRGLHALVRAVVRTNWFDDKPYIALKIDSSKLFAHEKVVPFREIFVCGPDVEGIHLRGGAVARGGLRWSDRPLDFRTEVLDLMKTQTVKNAPIVPTGAKGAFVVTPGVAAADAYRTFVSGMLDVTDATDPYLVVAADKGTARFSDLANAVAAEYDFWLGDAFAAGGSSGYDHKAIGITARGAWLAVRRHFAEAGRDIDTEQFTVAGIGDLSGDVFGNGMLLSRNIGLVAAFDHRHVFLDPDPDAARSYAERHRLFGLAHSSWDDYDRSSISPGGGVWPRTAKSIPVSAQVRARLGVDAAEATPDELVRAILRAPVDLLWNGGIGTYVRADDETDSDAKDPANDRVRVRASELRCAIVGEGGNLGLTQQARIRYSRNGGRINGDFIDNAAGVATSDREVNLKIALADHPQRDRLLADATEDVATAVLDDCADQVLAISLAAAEAERMLDRHAKLIGNLEADGGIDPDVEDLPSPAVLKRLAASGRGLTRPEIAVLLAQSKHLVSQELLDSTVPDDGRFADRLRAYFPAAVYTAAESRILSHPLRREIVATEVADELVNRIGPGTIFRMQERLGVTTAQVAVAYATVARTLDLDRLWADADTAALLEMRELVEHLTSWLLRNPGNRTVVTAVRQVLRSRDHGVASANAAVGFAATS